MLALASARPQFGGNPFLQQQQQQQNGQFSPNQSNQGIQNQQPLNQFRPNPTNPFLPNNGASNQGNLNQGGFNQGNPNQSGFNQGNFNQGSSNFGNPNQGGTLNEFFQQQQPTNPNQNQNQNQIPNQNQNLQPTTQSPQAASTSSPAFLNCTRNECLSTNEYNPVCGTDQVVMTEFSIIFFFFEMNFKNRNSIE